MFKHLRVVLRLVAVSLILGSFIWGVDKAVSLAPKSEVPVRVETSDGKIIPVTVLLVDEPTDVGPTFTDQAPATTTTPADSTPMIVHWDEVVYSESGVVRFGASGGVRCKSKVEAWTVMHSIASRNLDRSGRIYSVWMTEELSADREMAQPVSDYPTKIEFTDERPNMTAVHIDRVMEMTRHLQFLADRTDVSSERVDLALCAQDALLKEKLILLANLGDEFAENPKAYEEFVANTVTPAWKELDASWAHLLGVISSRENNSPAVYLPH